jgi:hypothetical protein
MKREARTEKRFATRLYQEQVPVQKIVVQNERNIDHVASATWRGKKKGRCHT